MSKQRSIMDGEAMQRAMTRITYEILERNKGADDLCIVGVLSRGVALGKRIADKISELENVSVPFGAIDITPSRDDINNSDINDKTEISFDIRDKRVILVDDVIFTGRTARAAIDALIKRGRPKSIQFAVLIDRGHRELPIRPDYVGKNLPTSREEEIIVSVSETDGSDSVSIAAAE
ncbi:MAG: bifunctional pyr operon transcriptional regulator/uracil phosphoribosyltransferase PyrR [Ruminococcus sp.]|nr:bifunctional pyr operon transcriptional regulator/uracil phosphoribosyltransferase PyrR [Ruminococcus sp.]MBQ7008382.1 bifunctional pyr operon transcriptional regulator/uracil phosphoribosyltransferase PyrR [Ruminococcus sp.]